MKISKIERPKAKSPYGVRVTRGQKRTHKFFETAERRDDYYAGLKKEVEYNGVRLIDVDLDFYAECCRLRDRLHGASLSDAVDFYLTAEHGGKHGPVIADAAKAYLAERESLADRGRVGLPTFKRDVSTMKRFVEAFAARRVGTIKPREISAWLAEADVNAITERNRRSIVRAFYNWLAKQGEIAEGFNPASKAEIAEAEDLEPATLSPWYVARLFAANRRRDPGICARLALEAFAGLRSSAATRVQWEQIDFENRAITLYANRMKKGRRQYLEGLPDNLWPWLERCTEEAFDMSECAYRRRKQKAVERARFTVWEQGKPPIDPRTGQLKERARNGLCYFHKNCLRHSFATYHVALNGNAALTALLISHKESPETLHEHYRGVRTKREAERHFSICP